ncbi:hypothetical protein TSUD_246330 [Trifolium subterraneum]|uniref:Terpene synthase metal-binding domain-containing protein n=1 Tax=Trifolium subterraneum TaxID=3900 RepID=A0A2Z6PIF1_TRISU|nr:hypothetical protein TSUD_246330 [Trifolium subterraneum]
MSQWWQFKKYIEGYMTEARWLTSNYKPTPEEYIHVSRESSGYALLNTTCYIGMGDSAIEDIFNWVSNWPKIVNAANVLCRIKDDIVTSELEKIGHMIKWYVQLESRIIWYWLWMFLSSLISAWFRFLGSEARSASGAQEKVVARPEIPMRCNIV